MMASGGELNRRPLGIEALSSPKERPARDKVSIEERRSCQLQRDIHALMRAKSGNVQSGLPRREGWQGNQGQCQADDWSIPFIHHMHGGIEICFGPFLT